MIPLVTDQILEIIYMPGKGAWTYHIEIPGTEDVYVRWGYTKVSGFIDDYEIKGKNLFSITGKNKWISLSAEIRKKIGRQAGDRVLVTLYLDNKNSILGVI